MEKPEPKKEPVPLKIFGPIYGLTDEELEIYVCRKIPEDRRPLSFKDFRELVPQAYNQIRERGLISHFIRGGYTLQGTMEIVDSQKKVPHSPGPFRPIQRMTIEELEKYLSDRLPEEERPILLKDFDRKFFSHVGRVIRKKKWRQHFIEKGYIYPLEYDANHPDVVDARIKLEKRMVAETLEELIIRRPKQLLLDLQPQQEQYKQMLLFPNVQ